MPPLDFDIRARDPDSAARAGVIRTRHGEVDTPAFVPVGTHATVKAVTPQHLEAVEAQILMSNAYHLEVRPGAETVDGLGGIHAFAGWTGPIMTDSGGFQVFSLADLREVDDDGVTFREPLDGEIRRFTPESVVAIQQLLGSDIAFPLDVCTPYPAERAQVEADLNRTHAWARRARKAHQRLDQALFGIVQGGVHSDLRAKSAAALAELDFPGYGIGGVSVGEPKSAMLAAVEAATPELPDAAPRHLLGVGYPEDIVAAVGAGIDTFDCVMPTRVARNGGALTMDGRLNLRRAEFAADERPIVEDCECYACRGFSRGAIRHWLKTDEILPLTLLTIHNLHFILTLMRDLRRSISDGMFSAWSDGFLRRYEGGAHQPVLEGGGAAPVPASQGGAA